MPLSLLIINQSDYLIQVADINSHTELQTMQIQISWPLKPTDLDLHCLQRQGVSRFSRTRINFTNNIITKKIPKHSVWNKILVIREVLPFPLYQKQLRYQPLTHLCPASNKRDIGKQCRPRSDAKECSIWSRSTQFALNSEISTKHENNKH